MSENVENINDNSFDEQVLQSEIPVLVDFWAPWCSPCKSIAPVLEEIAAEYAGQLKVVKINVDENANTPAQYNVRGLPNLVFFKSGSVVNQILGNVPKDQIEEAVKSIV